MSAENDALWLRLCTVGTPEELRALNLVAERFGMFSPEWNGRLLAIVREAWGGAKLNIEHVWCGDGEVIAVVMGSTQWLAHDDRTHRFTGYDLGEALVAAREAAPS